LPAKRLFEIARVLVRFNHIARVIVNANHSIVLAAVKPRVADCDFAPPNSNFFDISQPGLYEE
jgi:hypothetical protein